MPGTLKQPTVYTQLFWMLQDEKIDAETFANFSELYWPTFVQHGDFVFLKENFTDDEFHRLAHDGEDPEYWINLLTVDDFFSDVEDGEAQSLQLANQLVEMWGAKLKQQFPSKHFVVELLHDPEFGDCGLTFFQPKEAVDDTAAGSIRRPNIKENQLYPSPTGQRAGAPHFRRPRPEEIPQ